MGNAQYELNRQLLEAAKAGNLAKTEALLRMGADPLGPSREEDTREHILGELFCSAAQDSALVEKLPELVQLFYDYGMDIGTQDIPADDGNNINPLWDLAFCQNETGLKTLKVMLDNGLDVQSAEILVNHIFTDMELCDGCEIEDSWFLDSVICGLKMIMLVASYPYVTERSEYIRSCVEPEKNHPERLTNFRDWNEFDYQIDISTCDNAPYGLRNATVCIIDKKAHEHVWTLMV